MISILIPSRNEPYLQKTVDDIFAHAETDVEVLVGMDGYTDALTMKDTSRVKVIQEPEPIGQRAMMNRLAKMAEGKYLMKTDAHCSFGPGFDRIMLEDMQDDVIMAPYLLVLDAERWAPQHKPKSSSYCFDTNLVFQYNQRDENDEPLNETMCMQGSCFMVSRETYWKWNLCDETLGSWGQQGVELGIKAWENGGKCVTNKKTYYAHLFRHKETDFPYQRELETIRGTHNEFKKRYLNRNLARLIEKFNYPADWTVEAVAKL